MMNTEENKGIKKPHFVSEERAFRQHDWINLLSRHLLYTLCNESTKIS